MLVRQDQREAVAARLSEKILEGARERQVVMGLVHVERGVGTILLSDRSSPHAPLPDSRDAERAEEP